MKLPVIIASYERPLLLKQTIETLLANSDYEIELILVDDNSSNPEVSQYIHSIRAQVAQFHRYSVRVPIHAVKNKGELLASESEYIYFSDNDMYFEPHWDTKMISVLETHAEIGILGGLHHPHHQIDSKEYLAPERELLYSNEQPGYSMMLRRAEYKIIGPWFSEKLAGGEDSNLCMMAREQGFKIAALSYPVVLHCGMSGSHGNPAADAPQIRQMKQERPKIYIE